MAFTFVITEAAHAWGLDNYSTDTHAADALVVGALTSVVQSWGDGQLPEGSAGVQTFYSANGFSQSISMDYVDTFHFNFLKIETRSDLAGEVLHSMSGNVSLFIDAYDVIDETVLLGGDDTIIGNSYNNILQGWRGNDQIDGGAGIDTVAMDGKRSWYIVNRSGGNLSTQGPDGRDVLVNIERLKFDDCYMAFDTAGNGGQAYRLYQAAFNRAPDIGGLGYQITALDHGATLKTVAQNFINSPEFVVKYGNLDNTQFITKLYENVLHRAPDAGGLAYQQNALSSGSVDRAQLLVNFSESPENQAALIGTIQNGMVYTL